IGEAAGIRNCGDDFAARLAEIVDQRVGANSGRIELPESDALAVRAPLKAIADVEFFFVDPVGGAVDDAVGAVASELRDFVAGRFFGVDVVAANEGDLGAIRRKLREHEAGDWSVAANLAKSARGEIEKPVVATRVLTPDGLGICKEQELFAVGGEG